MPNGLFDHPVHRDTTPNSGAEMARRLGLVLLPASFVLGLGFTVHAFARQETSSALFAILCGLLCAGLILVRRRSRPSHAAELVPLRHDQTAPHPQEDRAARQPGILLLDASLGGAEGNSARALAHIAAHLSPHASVELASIGADGAAAFARLTTRLIQADALVIGTGVHWDSWSSSLQGFLEAATPAEATRLWLGKPVAVIVTEHSVGGKGVLSRLQGVLVTLGCEIPPLSGIVLSRAGQLARAAAPTDPAADDLWCPDDLAVVAANLLAATRRPHVAWTTWPVDRAHYAGRWLR